MTYETYVIISLRKRHAAEIQALRKKAMSTHTAPMLSDVLRDKLAAVYKEYCARSLNPVSQLQFNTVLLNSDSRI